MAQPIPRGARIRRESKNLRESSEILSELESKMLLENTRRISARNDTHHDSILKDLINRELGLFGPRNLNEKKVSRVSSRKGDFERLTMRILKKIVCSEQRQFKAFFTDSPTKREPMLLDSGQTWSANTFYSGGKLFGRTENRNHVTLNLRNNDSIRKPIYEISSTPKWEDKDLWVEPMISSVIPPLPKESHRPSLFILRQSNYLIRHSVSDGRVLDTVYLSDEVKFKELDCDVETSLITIKSTKSMSSRVPCMPADAKNNVCHFMVFQFPPLKFLAHFKVTKSVFGKDVVDACVNQGLLLIMYSSPAENGASIKAFDLKEIIRKNSKVVPVLGARMHLDDPDRVYGLSPLGFPLTFDIEEKPECLFHSVTYRHYLQIGSMPWKYIVQDNGRNFKIFDLMNEYLVGNGSIERKDPIDPEGISFHPDDSNRIIHSTTSVIEILEIVPDEENGSTLLERFRVDSNEVRQQEEEETKRVQEEIVRKSFSTSRRVRRTPAVPIRYGMQWKPDGGPAHRYLNELNLKSEVIFDYDDELDLLAFMTTRESDNLCMTLENVYFYDNQTYELLSKMKIDMTLPCANNMTEFTLRLDMDLLVLKAKTGSRCRVYLWKLGMAGQEWEENQRLLSRKSRH